jgi:hypothetical protein
MSSSSVATMFSDLMTDFGDTLGTVLPYILAVAAVLIGLNFGWKWVRRTIGRSK